MLNTQSHWLHACIPITTVNAICRSSTVETDCAQTNCWELQLASHDAAYVRSIPTHNVRVPEPAGENETQAELCLVVHAFGSEHLHHSSIAGLVHNRVLGERWQREALYVAIFKEVAEWGNGFWTLNLKCVNILSLVEDINGSMRICTNLSKALIVIKHRIEC